MAEQGGFEDTRQRHDRCLEEPWRNFMIRTVFRTLLVVVIVVAIAAFFIGYRWAGRDRTTDTEYAIGTSGGTVNVERARDTAANIGEKVAEGANQAQRVAASAALTAKIKSKMALDDTIEAADI